MVFIIYASTYVPLHAHDTFGSIGDSILRIPDYVRKARELNISSLALTNHGSMSTFVTFYEECKANNIKPIIGCEVYFCDDRTVHTKENKKYYHLILLAKNYNGLKNIIKIHNDSFKEGFYYRPRTDFSVLEKYNQDIICLTACVSSPLNKAYIEHDYEKLTYYINKLMSIYNHDLYLELQPGRFPEQIRYNELLVNLSWNLNIPLVVTNDIHYLNKEDYLTHDYHLKDAWKMDLNSDMIYPDKIYYLMSYDEILNSFVKTDGVTEDIIKAALNNTNLIAAGIDIKLPEINIMPQYSPNINEDKLLDSLCRKELIKRKLHLKPEYVSRLNYELDTIKTLKFSGYFLIVKDFLDFCDRNNIARGPGRGSAAGSLVSYLLGLSIADPIKYDLMFERFLSVNRKNFPDIDSDLSGDGRNKVYEHIVNRYGKNHCCFISTYNIRKARNAIKAACRILNIDPQTSNAIAKTIPYIYYDDDCEKHSNITIKEALESIEEFKAVADSYPEVIKIAQSIEGYPSSMGIHPAGIVISPMNIDDIYPLVRCNNDLIMATSLDLKDVEKLSGVKFDLLALSSLTVINDTLKQVKVKFDYSNEELLNDNKVWILIGTKNSAGLFQISSNTYKARMPLLHPQNIKELANCLALVRGPCISSGADKKYIAILNNKMKPDKIHDIYWEATKDTYGIVIYQEQILKICMNIGFDSEKAYNILKAVSKKKIDKINSYKAEFFKLGRNKNISDSVLNKIWSEIERAGLYAFNTAHAVSYALLCYCSAWLKTYYPLNFMANLLTKEYLKTPNSQTLNDILAECYKLNIKILPPDINKSQWNFTVEDNKIRMGFCSIKGMGEKAYKHIKSFENIPDFNYFINNISGRSVNKKTVLLLISAGCFNSNIKELAKNYMDFRKEKDWDGLIKIGTDKYIDINKTPKEIIFKYLFSSNLYKNLF